MASISNREGSSKKVQKAINKRERINSLPDSLLVHVLSFLPTKYAVRSSILSSRWKHLWASVPTLDFTMTSSNPGNFDHDLSRLQNFMNFVDRVLFNHDLSCIQKFRLNCSVETDDISRICTWIGVAIKRGVQELDIEIETPNKRYSFPLSLFTSPTLVVLKLGRFICFSVPSSVHFKSLKVLHVSICSPDNDLTQNLFSNCPVLEDLLIKGMFPNNDQLNFDISAPALKRFKLDNSDEEYYVGHDEHKIVINAPSLEYLSLLENYLPYYVLENLTSLVKADVDVGQCCIETTLTKQHADRVFELLRGICSVKYLFLGTYTMEVIDYADDSRLPLFTNLIRLELHVGNCCGWKRLLHLLNSMPNLVYLVLKRSKCWLPHHYEDDDAEDFNFVEQVVPCCLSTHLQEIEISGFQGLGDELRLIEYFWRNGSVLRKMTIKSCDSDEKREREFLKKLLKFPRGSRN